MNENSQLLKFSAALYKRRHFLIVYVIFTCIVAVSISLSVKKTYVSSATILTPSSSTGLSSFLPPSMTEGLGGAIGAFTSSPGSGLNTIMSILNSREIAEILINEFGLMEYFKSPTIEDAIEAYREMVSVTINDESMIKVSVYSETEIFHPDESELKSRYMAFDMAKYILSTLDSLNVGLETERARFQRQLIEKRYLKNQIDLKNAEVALMEFSQDYGVIALPEQFAASIQAAAKIESQLLFSKNELGTLMELYDNNSKEIQLKRLEIDQLNYTLESFLNKTFSPDSMSVLPAFISGPNLLYQYTSLYRDQRVQELLFEFLTQSYEQAKLDEEKQTPRLQYIDYPKLPTRKAAPSRAILSILVTLISLTFITTYVIFIELYKGKINSILDDLDKYSKHQL